MLDRTVDIEEHRQRKMPAVTSTDEDGSDSRYTDSSEETDMDTEHGIDLCQAVNPIHIV